MTQGIVHPLVVFGSVGARDRMFDQPCCHDVVKHEPILIFLRVIINK